MRILSVSAILGLAIGVLAGVAKRAEAGTCKAPRVLIVLDKSSSMVTGFVGSQTKWEVAKTAISKVVSTYQSTVDFGLMIFPDPNQCGAGKVKVPIGSNSATSITSQLAASPPQSGNYTPMAQSLDVAATLKGLQDSGYSNNVLLITDGWQWCYPYDAKTRFLPVNSTSNLTALGIKTYVVGFGESVDTLTLNKMAAAAKTKVSTTCDATGTDPKATNNCYYQANNPADLLSALQKIAKLVTAEICDNQDNDCDGQIDETLTRSCSSACGTGSETCNAGAWGGCSAPQPVTEACDGKDNDCDGSIDEGCACVDGQTQPCGVSKGECKQGTQTCSAGAWGTCTGSVGAAAETCDGKDNDCDGTVDENLTRSCQSVCGAGTETCSGGSYSTCTAPQPTQEICDGLDNDCDGTVDGAKAVCEGKKICHNGTCQDPPTNDTPMDLPADQGCDCAVGSGTALPAAPLAALLLSALALLLRRRRR